MKRLVVVFFVFVAGIVLSFSLQGQSSCKPQAFDHEALHVHDVQKSAGFYEQVMGLTKMPNPFNNPQIVWFRLGEHGQLHLIGGAESNSCQDSSVHLALRVGSEESFAAHLDEMHVKYQDADKVSHSIKARPDGVKQLYFQDPDGYWIEINDDRE